MSTLTQQIFLTQELYLAVLTESFLRERKASGLAEGTIGFYREKLNIFLRFCEEQSIKQVTELTPDFLRTFILVLGESHNSGGVLSVYRALKAFLRWVDSEEIVENWKNPISKVKTPKVPREPIKGISLDDFRKMLRTCRLGHFTGERDRAILLTLLDTGARASELLDIDLRDINLATGEITIKQGKGSKPRTVFYGEKTRKAIRFYLRHRHSDSSALFVTDEGTRLTTNGLREILKRRAKKAGLQETPSPHDFRRTFALESLRAGMDIYTLKRLMGHTSLSVLQVYLAQTDMDGLLAHRKYSPVDRV